MVEKDREPDNEDLNGAGQAVRKVADGLPQGLFLGRNAANDLGSLLKGTTAFLHFGGQRIVCGIVVYVKRGRKVFFRPC